MDVTIRKAKEADFPAILSLIKEFAVFQKTPEKVTMTLEQMVDGKDFFRCFVAEVDNKELVGFATYFFTWYSWSGKALYLDDLYVKESARKRGTGKKLLFTIIDLAKKEDCTKVRWQVSNWNTNAIAFYKSIGAITDDIEINCDLIIEKE